MDGWRTTRSQTEEETPSRMQWRVQPEAEGRTEVDRWGKKSMKDTGGALGRENAYLKKMPSNNLSLFSVIRKQTI